MNRRAFVAGSLGLLAAALAADAQTLRKVPRIGYVTSQPRSGNVDAFEQGLREMGYVVGQDIKIDYRFGEGHVDRVSALVAELLQLRIDLLVAVSPHGIRAARQATRTLPTVGIDLETDPVAAGWVQSWARPGGNLTGFFLSIPELSGKQLEFLAEAVPQLQKVAVLWEAQVAEAQFKATADAAGAHRLRLQSLPFRDREEFVGAFAAAQRQQAQALVLLSSPAVFLGVKRLADLALQHHLPAISVFPQTP